MFAPFGAQFLLKPAVWRWSCCGCLLPWLWAPWAGCSAPVCPRSAWARCWARCAGDGGSTVAPRQEWGMCSLPAASESPVSPVVTTRLVGCLGREVGSQAFPRGLPSAFRSCSVSAAPSAAPSTLPLRVLVQTKPSPRERDGEQGEAPPGAAQAHVLPIPAPCKPSPKKGCQPMSGPSFKLHFSIWGGGRQSNPMASLGFGWFVCFFRPEVKVLLLGSNILW